MLSQGGWHLMRYWRCWAPFNVMPLMVLWPLVGHCLRFQDGYVYCDRCPWHEALPVFFG